MKKLILILCLLMFTATVFAQQFTQYNTGTLFDSFENPAQRSFIPDSSRQFASNFFFPNMSSSLAFTGDAQQTLKNRLIYGNYNNSALVIGTGKRLNRMDANVAAYSIMVKMFTSLNGNVEVGFFTESKAEVKGVITDESVALFNGSQSFQSGTYDNIFNSRYNYQVYNQFGFTYREQINKQFALGIKLASVSGISNDNVDINSSSIFIDKTADSAKLFLQGSNRKAGISYLPFSNPGVSLSIGTTYRTADGFNIQSNIKDLGFIHWNKQARHYILNGNISIYDLTSGARESNVTKGFNSAVTKSKTYNDSFDTPLDGLAELSVNKLFYLDEEKSDWRYSPTLIASKELFFNGFTAAMVNPVQYKNVTVSVVTSYDDLKLFNWGAQFMVKGPNSEFFVASDRIVEGIQLLMAALRVRKEVDRIGPYSGGDFMIGASFKFGHIIEHPMNASFIPMGEKGFFGRLIDRIFPPDETKALAN